MNRRGVSTLTVVLGTIMVSSMIIFMSYTLIQNSYSSMARNFDNLSEYIKERTGIERLYEIFKGNISRTVEIDYDDIGKKYEIGSIETDYDAISIVGSTEEYIEIDFNIRNITDISIDIDFIANDIEDNEDISCYGIELFLNGEAIFTNMHMSGVETGMIISIPKEMIVNSDETVLNYGEYTLVICASNAEVGYEIEYDKQTYRKIKITDERGVSYLLEIVEDTLWLGSWGVEECHGNDI